MVFRISSAITIPKTIGGTEYIYIVIFNRLAGIMNVALLLPPTVHSYTVHSIFSKIYA